jgi:hypothetical protein
MNGDSELWYFLLLPVLALIATLYINHKVKRHHKSKEGKKDEE